MSPTILQALSPPTALPSQRRYVTRRTRPSCDHKVMKRARFEKSIGPQRLLNHSCGPFQVAIYAFKLGERRPMSSSRQRIGQTSQDPAWCPTMNIGIGAAHVTQGFTHPVVDRFKHEPFVTSALYPGPCHGQAKFKRHIETGGWRRGAVELNARHIVKRVRTATDQPENTL